MSKTLANLRNQTRMYLDESTQDDWKDDQVDIEINAGYHEVITAVMETYEKFYLITTTFDSVADQQEYDTTDGFPSDLFKISRVELNFDVDNANSIPRRAKPVDINSVLRDLGNSALGISVFRNPAYYLYGSGTGSSGVKLGFIPIPTRTGTNAIKVWYIQVQSDLSASTDNVNIPYADRYFKLISLYAAAQLLRKGQQEEIAAKAYMDEFMLGEERMKQQIEDRTADDTKQVIDTLGYDVDFSNYSNI